MTAALHGKHVLVEKPMALTIAECVRMNEAAERAGIHLLVGHSHSFDMPFQRARQMIASGEVGAVHMITALNFTDFLYRPRRPEELVTAQGGGVVFSQGAHQVDIVRLLGGGKVCSVRAQTGAWDRADLRPLPNGVMVYGDARAWLDPLPPPVVPRGEVLDEFCDAIEGVGSAIHTGRWAMATLEACLAILESSRTGSEVRLTHQVAVHDAVLQQL